MTTTPIIVRGGNQNLYASLFAGVWRQGTWLPESDWALTKDPETWEKVRRDAVVEHAISQRLHSIASRAWRIEAGGEDPASQVLAEVVEDVFTQIENFTTTQYQLAHGVLLGRSYGWMEGERLPKNVEGKMVDLWVPQRIIPIDRRRIRFGLRNEYKDGVAQNPRATPEIGSFDFGVWKALNREKWRNFIKVVYDDDESRLGYGRGILGAIYFYHYAKGVALREGLAGLERWAQGLKVAKIDMERQASTGKTNDQIQQDYIDAIEKTMARNTIAISKEDDLQVIWPSGSGNQMVIEILEYLDKGVTQLILGAVLPTGGGGSGGGSYARASVEEDSTERLMVYDRRVLDEAITRDLVGQFIRLNWPQLTRLGLIGARPPKFSSVNEKRQDPQIAATIIQTLLSVPGITLRADEVYEKTGFTKPKPGEEVIEGAQAPGQPPAFDGGDAFETQDMGEPDAPPADGDELAPDRPAPVGQGGEAALKRPKSFRGGSPSLYKRIGETKASYAARTREAEARAAQRLASRPVRELPAHWAVIEPAEVN